ncbi:uncharacterized protein SAPINGB_P000993 [Magnusiomyces paraingens]|uniref:Uncharacterized protein n=1 Tax=Magnusiomyces paraingens TaxID=2606893 RepID=A0A5E8B582_9ASCO|nr:uncharacterized protein SAPINGB_P000993 [Saprochaete ingens]VVT45993.1 unnamed protein product [Saprochaete ingens]
MNFQNISSGYPPSSPRSKSLSNSGPSSPEMSATIDGTTHGKFTRFKINNLLSSESESYQQTDEYIYHQNPDLNQKQQRIDSQDIINFRQTSNSFESSSETSDAEAPSASSSPQSKNKTKSSKTTRLLRGTDPLSKKHHELDLKRSMALVILSGYSLRQAASATGVSHETLRRRLRSLKQKTDKSSGSSKKLFISAERFDCQAPLSYQNQTQQSSLPDQNISKGGFQSEEGLNNQCTPEALKPILSGPHSAVDYKNNGPESENSAVAEDSKKLKLKDLGIDGKRTAKLKNELDIFGRLFRRELSQKAPELQDRLMGEYEKIKRHVYDYTSHTTESLQMAKAMIFDDIKQYEWRYFHSKSVMDLTEADLSLVMSPEDLIPPVNKEIPGISTSFHHEDFSDSQQSLNESEASQQFLGTSPETNTRENDNVRRVTSISNIINKVDY